LRATADTNAARTRPEQETEDHNTDFRTTKTEVTKRRVNRISVAVLVDGSTQEREGRPGLQGARQGELDRIGRWSARRSAFDQKRGDQRGVT